MCGRPWRKGAEVVVANGALPKGEHAVEIHICNVVFHRNHHITGITSDHDVGDVLAEWDPVQGCVGLDEAAMLLRPVGGHDLLERADGLIQPG